MKCKIPEISWHNRDPVLSVDIQPKTNGNQNRYRLASGGTDAHVLIWYMKLTSGEHGDIELDLAADLSRHQKAVNVVKWSPNGELLASGDDESFVIIWKLKSDSEPLNILDPTNDQDKEVWITLKVLRGHVEDIYDLSWSPDSQFLVTGSVDNSAMLWDVHKGRRVSTLIDHKGFVQGVAWDPKNQYIATLSTDRYLRIFDIQSKKVLYRISKGTLPVPATHTLHGKRMRLFHDDTLQTFFRRLSFTPDGKLLLTPAGVTDYDGCTKPINTTYAFSRYGFRQPAIVLPCPDQYTVAVRCCPLLFKLRPFNAEKNPPVVPLPYRMIFAVATKSSVYFYDTQQKQPFALISNIHYTRLTDVTWSNDGRIVVVSSTDGFCSLITFEQGELGEEYENSEAVLEAALAQVTKKAKKSAKEIEGSKSRKLSTDDNTSAKDIASAPKEMQLEKVVEEKSTDNKTDNVIEENKSNNTKIPTPIDIKPKPGPVEKSPNKSNQTKSEIKATPIAIKRKPGPVEENDNKIKTNEPINTTPVSKSDQKTNDEDKITAKDVIGTEQSNKEHHITSEENKLESKESLGVGIKRKAEPISSDDNKKEEEEKKTDNTKKNPEESTSTKVAAVISSKVLAAEIILDKEILSTDERFESPEKKSRPVTPIMVRRHPRTPSSTTHTPTSMANVLKSQKDVINQSPLSSLSKERNTPRQDKKATPIAVRRTPRAIITTPSVVNTTSLVEDAMDVWPINTEPDKETAQDILGKNSKTIVKENVVAPLQICETTTERTEDIRLVYEETNEEAPIKASPPKALETEEERVIGEKKPENTPNKAESVVKPQTPGAKTPRRVALKTISTPKSKKNLLDSDV